jgi:SNF2 family DNA or RNA helicase
MIAAGTIEERMLELQERKRAIANTIYSEENDMPLNITQADLECLFKPLGN